MMHLGAALESLLNVAPWCLSVGCDCPLVAHATHKESSAAKPARLCMRIVVHSSLAPRSLTRRRVTNRTLVLPSFACWCEQDQVATVLETCVMKVRRRPKCFYFLASFAACQHPEKCEAGTHQCVVFADLALGSGQNAHMALVPSTR